LALLLGRSLAAGVPAQQAGAARRFACLAERHRVNMDAGEMVEQVIESFELLTPLQDVMGIYAHAKRQRPKSFLT
jgi:hypothetical protein